MKKKGFIVILIAMIIVIIIGVNLPKEKINVKVNEESKEIKEIPREYYIKSTKEGRLEEFYYDTYESKTYNDKSKKITKRAIVYTPFGYDEEKEYDIIYLMHGGWSNETTILGTPSNPSTFKNVIDNAIEKGEIRPIIIVCPTYNNESNNDSSDYTLAYYTLTVNYHNELENDLIPSVESKYHTYAKSSTHEGIVFSRNHRAFGGFSMGSVTTWHTFVNNLDSFRYFITSSGAIDADIIDTSVAKQVYTKDDFFIVSFTGTEDFAESGFTNLIDNLINKKSNNFVSGTNENEGNLYFRVNEGYSHDGTSQMTYMYNGILSFYNNK